MKPRSAHSILEAHLHVMLQACPQCASGPLAVSEEEIYRGIREVGASEGIFLAPEGRLVGPPSRGWGRKAGLEPTKELFSLIPVLV